eukprot:6507996-Prymnesium_polylepis.1
MPRSSQHSSLPQILGHLLAHTMRYSDAPHDLRHTLAAHCPPALSRRRRHRTARTSQWAGAVPPTG